MRIETSSWEPILRYNGHRTYTAYRCPQCIGTGDSPYYDENDFLTPCECCQGKGYSKEPR
jgi:DnaJ-class molecular chaperone